MRTTHLITTKHGNFIALIMAITCYYHLSLDFGEVLFNSVILANFLQKIGCVLWRLNTFLPYLINGLSDWCGTKGKCNSWILGIICNLDLWPHSWPWPWMLQGQISKQLYLRNYWSDWCEMKRKQIDRILSRLYDLVFWPQPWPWPWSFKVKVWKNLIAGMGWQIDMERKGCELSIHDHDID